MTVPAAERERPPYLWALVTFALTFTLYLLTLSPTTAMWDASEYISSARVLGIPHPPGNPLFTLMAHVWGLLPLATEYARRINIFAAFTSAAGAGLWFLVAERWLRAILPDRSLRLLAAFAGVFASATAWTVWNQSVVSEKVYTVSMLSVALVAWFAVLWADEPAGKRRDRWLVAAIYIIALSSTNHTMGVLGAPVLGIHILLTDWRVLLRPQFLLAALAAVALGLTPNYLYLPIRAGQFPPINEGEPIGFFSKALLETLGRKQYLKPALFPRQPWVDGQVPQSASHLMAQLGMYWHYWSWQWSKDVIGLRGAATALFTLLGLGGLLELMRRDRRAGWSALALMGTLTVALVFYLNFKFGYYYHQADPSITNEMREVRDRDYFFIVSFAFAGVLIAAGFAAAIVEVQKWLGERGTAMTRRMVPASMLLLALIPLVGNHISAPRNHETLARDYAIDMLQSVAPYGVLITAGDNDTFPLWYAQEVLGVRRDVTLANLSLLGTDWHVRQLQRRVTPQFDPANAAPIWRSQGDTAIAGPATQAPWRQPTAPALTQSIATLDAIPDLSRVPTGSTIAAGGVDIHFATEVVTRTDIMVALLLRDNFGQRRVYFSATDGTYPDEQLGLAAHLLTQGLVREVVADSIHTGNDIADSEYLGHVDIPRTASLLFNVYHRDTATRPRAGGWYDPPSADMLSSYLRVYAAFAPLLDAHGDSTRAQLSAHIAEEIHGAMTGN